ncbi:MAG: TIR domain-containing protein [Anaerobutyricum hallii]|uniref:TIR domain-containing protein n=1 Tax=Anaerobutyricum hallii TaxID=39488 RepID=UPI002A801148|nr:TIR domain-containing protein [Anaerobutyricum hallii]MDY4577470.1 TIR domain-containing protein [Anaerobutyricum hallii]
MKNYKYDIFISYKHEALDKAVAARLQKSLEHYKIPKEIQKKTGKNKIKRVFRDEEELAVSSDLGKEIEGQIAQSEYLLVVCSKKTKESQWVLKEIDTFLKYRDAEHILPVLIEGEPEESLPKSILAYGEPMAADVRGKNEKEVLKKVKKELPRLIAPILHCSYDELKQRARNYQIKRMLIGTSVALVAVASFAAYAVFQSARLNKEYQETRRNQARNMAQTSEKLLECGDRMGALKTALAVLPENKNSKEALVPEQMRALNDALYSYEADTYLYFRPMRAEYIEDQIIGKIQWSPNREYYMSLDAAGYVYFFDGKTGKCIWKEFGDDLKEKVEGFYATTFIDNNTAALLAEEKICIVNFKEKTLERTIELNLKVENLSNEYSSKVDEYGIIYNKNEILVYGTESIAAYNLKTEQQSFIIKKESLKKDVSLIIYKVIYANKDTILIGISGSLVTEGGLFSYSIRDKKIKQISSENIEDIYLINNQYIGVSQYKDDDTIKYEMCIYDYRNGKKIYSKENLEAISEEYEYIGWYSGKMKINQKSEDVVMFYFRDTIYCILLSNFKVINEERYIERIAGIEKYDDTRVIIGTASGKILRYISFTNEGFSKNVVEKYYDHGGIEPKTRNSITQFSYSKKSLKTVVQVSDNDKMIITSGILKDTRVSKKFMKKDFISDVVYYSVNESGEEKNYRCVKYAKWPGTFKDGIAIYEVGKSSILYQVEMPEDTQIGDYVIRKRGKDTVFCYIEFNGQEQVVHIINLKEKKEIEKYKLGDEFLKTYAYSKDLSYIWYSDNDNLKCMKLSPTLEEKTDAELEKKKQGGDAIEKICVSDNNQYVVVVYLHRTFSYQDETYNVKESYYLKIWDVENGTWKKINGEEKIQATILTEKEVLPVITFSKKHNWMAIRKMDSSVEIIDLDKGITQHILSFTGKKNKDKKGACSIGFFNNDRYMIIKENANQIAIWDIEKEKRIMRQEVDMSNYSTDAKIEVGEQFFAIVDSSANVMIFTVDENQRFSLYSSIDGWVDLNTGEVIIDETMDSYFYISKIYNFQELKKEALKVLDGETLTKEEKRKYFLEE